MTIAKLQTVVSVTMKSWGTCTPTNNRQAICTFNTNPLLQCKCGKTEVLPWYFRLPPHTSIVCSGEKRYISSWSTPQAYGLFIILQYLFIETYETWNVIETEETKELQMDIYLYETNAILKHYALPRAMKGIKPTHG